jgi:hypothetical protein
VRLLHAPNLPASECSKQQESMSQDWLLAAGQTLVEGVEGGCVVQDHGVVNYMQLCFRRGFFFSENPLFTAL